LRGKVFLVGLLRRLTRLSYLLLALLLVAVESEPNGADSNDRHQEQERPDQDLATSP
jgi:hypothetical protein